MTQNSSKYKPDIILRSSDGVLIYTWRALLALSSPIFDTTLTLPRGNTSNTVDETHEGLPVIDLEEDNRTLTLVLHLCYPVTCHPEKFEVKNFQELASVLAATKKYEMDAVRPLALQELNMRKFFDENPLKIFALACQEGCMEAARWAAKRSLTLPTLAQEDIFDLDKIDAGKLHALLRYRETCAVAASALVDDYTWVSGLFARHIQHQGVQHYELVRLAPDFKIYRKGRFQNVTTHGWWAEYMRKSGFMLWRKPCGTTVKEQKLVDETLSAIEGFKRNSKCNACGLLDVKQEFLLFVDQFADEVEKTIASIDVVLKF